jgi:hypothetical protein
MLCSSNSTSPGITGVLLLGRRGCWDQTGRTALINKRVAAGPAHCNQSRNEQGYRQEVLPDYHALPLSSAITFDKILSPLQGWGGAPRRGATRREHPREWTLEGQEL